MEQNYGLQLYSVRDSAKEDFAGTLKRVAELGFIMVVESEGLEPDGLSEVARCRDFLNTLEV